ncbi:TPA: hypothetical protein DIV55_05780 [Patescibacteria group bacterium]|uniref:Ribbon-helix-helix protein CopG domain-containing protein n=1 Tax=Candidatus Gottesmanbacteria bacterium GW2011_GWA1_43_11 TaxID=1618436 RepID=A0A0G1CJD6_9BACT|nr:MAG: hypothetical protein UV59_C0006G0050 [Candidatus Gottesmanbacteria bacterium GW2011_GWA1_43_11]HCS79217.1 hypothetical protein [Patescibacteria group bacterium]
MVRTQIYLDKKLHKELTELAKQTRKSMARVARELLHEGIKRGKLVDQTGIKILESITHLELTGGPVDLSTNHDHYLYGKNHLKYAQDL